MPHLEYVLSMVILSWIYKKFDIDLFNLIFSYKYGMKFPQHTGIFLHFVGQSKSYDSGSDL